MDRSFLLPFMQLTALAFCSSGLFLVVIVVLRMRPRISMNSKTQIGRRRAGSCRHSLSRALSVCALPFFYVYKKPVGTESKSSIIMLLTVLLLLLLLLVMVVLLLDFRTFISLYFVLCDASRWEFAFGVRRRTRIYNSQNKTCV